MLCCVVGKNRRGWLVKQEREDAEKIVLELHAQLLHERSDRTHAAQLMIHGSANSVEREGLQQ